MAPGGRYLSDREQLIRAASEQIFTNLELILVQLRPETLTKCRRGELGPSAWLRSSNNQEISPLQDVRNYDMELFPDF